MTCFALGVCFLSTVRHYYVVGLVDSGIFAAGAACFGMSVRDIDDLIWSFMVRNLQ